MSHRVCRWIMWANAALVPVNLWYGSWAVAAANAAATVLLLTVTRPEATR